MKQYTIRLFLIIILFGSLTNLFPQIKEYTLKTVFIERFTRFTKWTDDSLDIEINKPFIITVLGESPFESELDEFFSSIMIKNKKVEIHYISNINEIKNCHILFISKSERRRLKNILKHVSDKSILTIGDTEGFAEMGVIINFYMNKNKIHFEINEEALKKSGLIINYLLLHHARLVKYSERLNR